MGQRSVPPEPKSGDKKGPRQGPKSGAGKPLLSRRWAAACLRAAAAGQLQRPPNPTKWAAAQPSPQPEYRLAFRSAWSARCRGACTPAATHGVGPLASCTAFVRAASEKVASRGRRARIETSRRKPARKDARRTTERVALRLPWRRSARCGRDLRLRASGPPLAARLGRGVVIRRPSRTLTCWLARDRR